MTWVYKQKSLKNFFHLRSAPWEIFMWACIIINWLKNYFDRASARALNMKIFISRQGTIIILAGVFDKENIRDSCIYYARIGLQLCRDHNFGEFTLDASTLLTHSYELEGKSDSTLKYMRIMLAAKDSVFSQSKGQQFRQFAFDEIQRVQKINAETERYQTRIKLYILASVMGRFFILAFILYRNNRQKQKAKAKIEKAYAEFKIHPGPTHPIGKNGFPRRTDRRYCT